VMTAARRAPSLAAVEAGFMAMSSGLWEKRRTEPEEASTKVCNSGATRGVV
jgi:hypothetical protein